MSCSSLWVVKPDYTGECLFSKYDEDADEYVDSSLKELDEYKTERV